MSLSSLVTITDAALNGGMDTGIDGTSSGIVGNGGNVNFRLGPLASVTSSSSSSSSSISAFSSSSSSSSATETERPRIFRNKHHHERHWGPFFEEPLNSTTSGDNSITTAHLYTEAVLNCRVGMLKDKTVCLLKSLLFINAQKKRIRKKKCECVYKIIVYVCKYFPFLA